MNFTDRIHKAITAFLTSGVSPSELWVGPDARDDLSKAMQPAVYQSQYDVREGDVYLGLEVKFKETDGIHVGRTVAA